MQRVPPRAGLEGERARQWGWLAGAVACSTTNRVAVGDQVWPVPCSSEGSCSSGFC